MCREVVGHLNWRKLGPGPTMPDDEPVHDPDELLSMMPRDLAAMIDCREVIARFVDGSRFEEFKARYGTTVICGWASVHGFPVGVIGNNGPLFNESSEKAAQFIQLCNQQDIPILFLHNITGYMVGKDFEHGGIVKNCSKLCKYKLLSHDGKKYDGYTLSYMGYDYLALKAMVARGSWVARGSRVLGRGVCPWTPRPTRARQRR